MKKGELIELRCKEFYKFLEEKVEEEKRSYLQTFYRNFFGEGTGEEVMKQIVRSGVRKNELVLLISKHLGLLESVVLPYIENFYLILDA